MMVREEGRRSERVAFPVVCGWIDYDALHRRGGIVAFEARGIAAVIAGDGYGAPIGIKQNLRGIEPHAVDGIIRPVDAVAVELAGLHAGHKYMPVMVCAVADEIDGDDARGPGIVFPLEQKQLHGGGVARIQAEIGAPGNEGSAERRASPIALDTDRCGRCVFRSGCVPGGRHGLCPGQNLLGCRDHGFRLETEFLLEFLERRRGTESFHPDHSAGIAHIAFPSERGGLLDGDPRLYRRAAARCLGTPEL